MAEIDFEYIKIDVEQVKETYIVLRDLVYEDMERQYKEGKIHGPDYANTWAGLMSGVISGTLNAIVALQSKETEADRCVKYATCEKVKQETAKVKYETNTLLKDDHEIKLEQKKK